MPMSPSSRQRRVGARAGSGAARVFLLCGYLVAGSCQRAAVAPSPGGSATSLPGEGAAAPPGSKGSVPSPYRPGWGRPPVIDFHSHLSYDGLDRLRVIRAAHGIETFVNLSGGSARGGGVQWLASDLLACKLAGGVINFFSPDWRDFGQAGWAEREVARLEYAVERHGLRGIKISKALGLGATVPDGSLVMPDDPRLGPLWAKAAELGLPVSIHVADPKAFWQPLEPGNERWDELKAHPSWSYADRPEVASWAALLDASERLFAANPRTTFVAVHFGNAAEELDRVARVLDACPNVWLDVSARIGEFGRHPRDRVRAFFARYQDRIVFGTDIGIGESHLWLGSNGSEEPTMADVAPFYEAHFRYFESDEKQIAHPSPIQGNWRVDAIGLDEALLTKLYRGNALRLLDRAFLRSRAAASEGQRPPATPPAVAPLAPPAAAPAP